MTEKRKPLSRREFGLILVRQNCRCACCSGKLDFSQPRRVIDEHLHPLADGGGNEITNRALYCHDCAKGKTLKEVLPRTKSKRRAEGRTQTDRRKARGASSIQGQGFQKRKTQWPKGRKIQSRGFGK